MWEKVQLSYVKLLENTPYLGGKKCSHNSQGGTYDCIALFAYYDALDGKPTIDELYEMNNEVLLPPFKSLGKIVNANRPCMQRLLSKVFEMTANGDKKHEEEYLGYIMRCEPYDKQIGIRYRFERCPIAEFAKENGFVHLMPAICNGDYPAFELMHAFLIRKSTCANGNVCDYLLVGDKSDLAKKHPIKVDADGYMYNE